MAGTTLTDATIKSAIRAAQTTGQRQELKDPATKGLTLRITPSGTATWVLRYRGADSKNPKRLTLGRYSDGLLLSAARNRAEVERGRIVVGFDPIAEKKAQREAMAAMEEERASRVTFAEIAETYIVERIPKKVNADKNRIIVKNALGALGDKAVEDIVARDVRKIIDAVKARGAKAQAHHVFAIARAILNFAVERQEINQSPLHGMKVAAGYSPRERVLDASEIRIFWTKLDAAVPYEVHRDILRLQLVTGARIGEVCGITRSEVDLDKRVWRLPKGRTKNKRAHEIPLSPLAREIITRRMSESEHAYLFPNKIGTAPVTAMQMAYTMRDAQPVFDFKDQDGILLPCTTHDIRRSVATGLENIGIPTNVISAALNHIGGKRASVTTAHYIHRDLSREVRKALTRWQGTLESILEGHDPFAPDTESIDEMERRELQRGRRPHLKVVTA